MTLTDTEKAAAARKSLEYIKDGMVVGLGTRFDRHLCHSVSWGTGPRWAEDSRNSYLARERGAGALADDSAHQFR